MALDMIIRNGHVIDSLQGIDQVMDIAVAGGKIVPLPDAGAWAAKTVDASGCYVLPGLIDFHTHTFYKGNEDSANPDYMLATGVTATVDTGSAGWTNYRAFYNDILCRSRLKIKSFLSYTDFGVDFEPESYEAKDVHEDKIRAVFDQYGNHLLGIKLRMMKGLVANIDALKRAVVFAKELGVRVCVHPTNAPCEMDDIVDLLDAGDILCHVYHGTGSICLDSKGKVRQSLRRARERGVIFDVANGRKNFSFSVAKAALADGFYPDIISTDMTSDKMHYDACAKSMPYVMSKMLALGMSLPQVVKASTECPAAVMGLAGKIGTLKPGACADIAVFRLIDCVAIHRDALENTLETTKMLYPEMTICDGEIAFCQINFNLCE